MLSLSSSPINFHFKNPSQMHPNLTTSSNPNSLPLWKIRKKEPNFDQNLKSHSIKCPTFLPTFLPWFLFFSLTKLVLPSFSDSPTLPHYWYCTVPSRVPISHIFVSPISQSSLRFRPLGFLGFRPCSSDWGFNLMFNCISNCRLGF